MKCEDCKHWGIDPINLPIDDTCDYDEEDCEECFLPLPIWAQSLVNAMPISTVDFMDKDKNADRCVYFERDEDV